MVQKGEINYHEQFLLLTQSFHKFSHLNVLKPGLAIVYIILIYLNKYMYIQNIYLFIPLVANIYLLVGLRPACLRTSGSTMYSSAVAASGGIRTGTRFPR